MPKGREPKNNRYKPRLSKESDYIESNTLRVEMKEIHGQLVEVKICKPGSVMNPIGISEEKKAKSNQHFEPNRLSLGPISSGLHGSKTVPSFRRKKIDDGENEG